MHRIAVLIDLPREAAAGGHVKYWERLAEAAAREPATVDLTFYFSGNSADEHLSAFVHYRYLPPVFSTARLKFLPYVPAHTDLAAFHPALARELSSYDVIHTTDAFFAFARTAERVARWHKIPLVSSFHTDTPAYAELFTRQTLQSLLGKKFGTWIDGLLNISVRARRSKELRLKNHLSACDAVLAMRGEDLALARSVVPKERIKPMRLGVDKELFSPRPAARQEIEDEYKVLRDKFMVLFVGRVDAGKNVPVLMEVCAKLIERGLPLHLLVAGVGPLSDELLRRLGGHATLAGLLEPQKLATFYAGADCLAITSEIEIGGMIGLEALSCGCPVLVSRKSGIAQLCGSPLAMEIVETGQGPWRKALEALMQDHAKLSVMREAAITYRQNALASWRDVLSDYMPIWQNLARREGP